ACPEPGSVGGPLLHFPWRIARWRLTDVAGAGSRTFYNISASLARHTQRGERAGRRKKGTHVVSSFSYDATSEPEFAAFPDRTTAYQPSIMVIDDSPSVRKVIEATFIRIGITVSSYPDGLSAIKAMTNGEAPVPALLLLDLGLPRMDGYEVAGLLRNHPAFAQTILLMLTAHDGMWNRIRSKLVGAQG